MLRPAPTGPRQVRKQRNPFNDAFIMRRNDLTAIAPVNFVPVVLLRIVARCDNNARCASEFSDRERKLQCRAQCGKQMDLNAVANHDLSYYPSECRAVVAES